MKERTESPLPDCKVVVMHAATRSFALQELSKNQAELGEAKAKLEQYARQLENRVRIHEEKYQRLMEEANDAIFLLDPHGRVLEVNHKGEHLLGQSTAAILGRSLEDFVPALR